MKVYVVLIMNNRTESFDILGGVFDTKQKLNEFIKLNNLIDGDYEIETVKINNHNYVTI